MSIIDRIGINLTLALSVQLALVKFTPMLIWRHLWHWVLLSCYPGFPPTLSLSNTLSKLGILGIDFIFCFHSNNITVHFRCHHRFFSSFTTSDCCPSYIATPTSRHFAWAIASSLFVSSHGQEGKGIALLLESLFFLFLVSIFIALYKFLHSLVPSILHWLYCVLSKLLPSNSYSAWWCRGLVQVATWYMQGARQPFLFFLGEPELRSYPSNGVNFA